MQALSHSTRTDSNHSGFPENLKAAGRSGRWALCAIVIWLATACSDPLAPFQPEVTNAADNFQLQATGVDDVDATLTYAWSNSGTRATINHSTTTTQGTARLIVRDAAGTVVYDKTLMTSLNEPTATGAPGAWTIELRIANYSGTMNFRAQKL